MTKLEVQDKTQPECDCFFTRVWAIITTFVLVEILLEYFVTYG